MDRLRARIEPRAAALGLVGAVLLLAGSAWYQSLITPPYRFIDEQAHAGYVLEVQRGRLPTIDTPIDQERGGVALRTRLQSEPERRRDVWVANNPPLTYAVAAGPAALTRALGLPGGPLLGLRLLNVAAVAGAVALTYVLARDLAGGDRTVGLVAAGLLAATPHLGFVASLGFNDGTALLATTAVLVALARVAGAVAGSDAARDVRLLGVTCAISAAVRPMALVLAAVAGLIGVGLAVRRRGRPWWPTLGWIAGPAAVLAGWSYALNVVRYGDPTGSSALFEKFGRSASESLGAVLTTRGIWESLLRTITTRRLESPLPTDRYGWYTAALVTIGAGLLLAAAVAVRSRRAGHADGTSGPLPGAAWAAVAATGLVPVLLTAQHRAGGGAAHPRYLLPLAPVVVAAVALGIVRVLGRWSGYALVVGVSAVMAVQTRHAARWLADNPKGPAGSELVTAYGSELLRGLGLAASLGGLLLLAAALAWPPGRRSADGVRGDGAELPV